MNEIRILSPTAILGYGFPQTSFERGLAEKPDVIAVDAGSTDPGPYYLGEGKSFVSPSQVERDLKLIVEAGMNCRVPIIIGTAGGSGAKVHLDQCVSVIQGILSRYRYAARLAVIPADIDKHLVRKALREEKITCLPFVPELTDDVVRPYIADCGTDGLRTNHESVGTRRRHHRMRTML